MYPAFLIIAGIAIGIQALLLFLAFFGPDLPSRVREPPECRIDSEEFSNPLFALTYTQLHGGNEIEVLSNGNCFYES